ncbi:DUF423 domain-containing protein [Vibrio nitrifigilis]|uniref:DUF423 domain-containing protein n=1 Tax=Vibrio nitrifigilis TaxID=2789781 RepID=A0ABS0GBG8_9VIBR|nr:DUF423 domain-containing protein [Vibrio nitrifigilis]MBF8999749.1 DUF423 domain-containing protein [Vibrio nitrifigilis]
MQAKSLLAIGGIFSGLGVVLGAFAAHGLKSIVTPKMDAVFQVGVHYQFIHAAAILLVGVLMLLPNFSAAAQKNFSRAAICFIIGIFCFSGSLYALALTGVKWIGPITPLGGLLFILGWVFFVVAALKSNEVNS